MQKSLILSCLTLFSVQSSAHPLDLGVVNILGTGHRLQVRLELNPQVGAQLLNLNEKDLSVGSFDSYKSQLYEATLRQGKIQIGEKPCTWREATSAKIENPALLSLDAAAECQSVDGELTLDLPFLRKLSSTYRLLAVIRLGSVEHVGGADPAHPTLHFSFQQPSFGFVGFVQMGLEHIGVAPSEWHDGNDWHLPKGLDHILFVLALLLTGGTLRTFLKTITGFTIGHTTSLALVTFGVLHAGGRWIEAAIALTIAFVAAQAMFSRTFSRFQHGFLVAIGIGLIHGLGFAAAISGLTLATTQLIEAVLGFNLGVELGQALVVLLIAPPIIYCIRYRAFRRFVIPGLGGLIFIASVRWFFMRI